MKLNYIRPFFDIDREARLEFINSHEYEGREQKLPTFKGKSRKNKKRKRLILIYTSLFCMDSMYEYFIFREVISRINDAKLNTASLGHWIPLTKFGHHCVSNWMIQSVELNGIMADEVPAFDRPSYKEQIKHIEHMIKDFSECQKRSVRDMYNKLKEVYK